MQRNARCTAVQVLPKVLLFTKSWNAIQLVVFKPISYCFEETIGFDKQTSFARPPVLPLIKSGDITKEFPEKTIQFHWNFNRLKITN